jgi:hypothetical protein
MVEEKDKKLENIVEFLSGKNSYWLRTMKCRGKKVKQPFLG